jgi:uncharacterized protein YxjI
MSAFADNEYLIRKKILKVFGGAFHIYDVDGNVVAYSKMKAFKLKEDLRMYTGEDMTEELFRISARNIIDFGATYDVFDSKTDARLGALRRKGMKSLIRDEWLILDANECEIGMIQEDSAALALIRRFVVNLIPQKFTCTIDGTEVCDFGQNFNPFVSKIRVGFKGESPVDRRLLMSGALLLCAIEGKQD